MSDDEDWFLEDGGDAAYSRSMATLNIAMAFGDVKDRRVQAKLLQTMDLLNECLAVVARPKGQRRPAPLLPLRGSQDE